MNSANWTFVGNHGKTSQVNLKHGVESGNLIIFCNKKVLLIDYDVFEKANYTFFIDDEFCQINVKKEKEKFQYQFDILDNVDTPLNKRRKAYQDKQYYRTVKMALISFGLIAFIVGGGVGIKYYRATQKKAVTKATFVLKPHQFEGKFYNAAYTFKHGKNDFLRHLELPELQDGTILTTDGFPVMTGDQFLVVYRPHDPTKNELLYSRPTKKQLKQYQERLLNKMLFDSPELNSEYCICLMENYYELNGLSGYVALYFRHATLEENSIHNQETHEIFARHPKIIEGEKGCFTKYCM